MSNYCITIYFCYQLCIKSIKKSISLKILTRFARECENSRPDFCPKTKNPGFSFRHYVGKETRNRYFSLGRDMNPDLHSIGKYCYV